ncbi:ComF family protein [Levilactobacillus humaensis]|uniref:ComF family protein n=1 Tax=Levilactobacillus humaensis TaxID=2950375 RepID=UPI0021C3BABB|nr:ComF family protein [Levilactobacillus humaensis]
MLTCVWCGRSFAPAITVTMIWQWRPLPQPALCATCHDRLTPISPQHCPQCGRQQTTVEVCRDCRRWHDNLRNRAVYRYDAGMKAYMQQYKFQGDYRLRLGLQEALRLALEQVDYDILVPIPIDERTWQTRGFNQVTGWLTGQPFQQALAVTATHKDRPQSAKTRQERLLTPQPFELVAGASDLLANRRVLLLDDVYTTGRTLRHAAQQIYLGGAKAVTSLTLAR